MADAILAARRRLALNAREARRRLGLSQEQAAERVGVAVMSIRRVERASAAVTVDFVARLAQAYGVDVGTMLVNAGRWVPASVGRPTRASGTGTDEHPRGRSGKARNR